MDNYSKRRFYLNKREQNNSYPASINPDKNMHKLNNIKLYDESHNRRFLGINSNTSEIIDNKDKKKEILIKEYTKEELSNFDLSFDSPINLSHKIEDVY